MKSDRSRNITSLGGLLSYDYINNLQVMDNNDPLLHPDTFKLDASEILDKKGLIDKYLKIWKELVDLFYQISLKIETFDEDQIYEQWLSHLFKALDFKIEKNKGPIIVGKDIDHSIVISHNTVNFSEAPLIHIVSPSKDLDLKTGRKKTDWSPHDRMQIYLNQKRPLVNWGIITNGLVLRLVREFYHVSTKGYIEFDLQNIFRFREDNFREFLVLFRLIHPSRFIPREFKTKGKKKDDDEENEEEPILKPIIESMYLKSSNAGLIIGDKLRENVKRAIEILGNGFLTNELIEILKKDEDALKNYYNDLLKIIYRIIFLLFAEQREMLPTRGSIYAREYSITALREKAFFIIDNDPYTDLWEGLKVTFNMLKTGCDELKVYSYNGDLFNDGMLFYIHKSSCRNNHLLRAVQYLTYIQNNNIKQKINYIDLGVEEIGSIYESLLDFTPIIANEEIQISKTILIPKNSFYLEFLGKKRKTTGSYYTRPELINLIIDNTVKIVLEEKLKEKRNKQEREAELLSIRICDPACGSGAFLIAATNFLGRELARIRTNTEFPSEEKEREARHAVLQHCIYGVDINPMAVELAKVSLWIDASVKDLPLNFLNHHIKRGNSLIGATASLIKKGIQSKFFSLALPKEKFEDKKVLEEIKKKNTNESKYRLLDQFYDQYRQEADDLDQKIREFKTLQENNLEEYFNKKKKYEELRTHSCLSKRFLIADIWASSFFWPMIEEYREIAPTQQKLIDLTERDRIDSLFAEEVNRLKKNLSFFHWHLEFPEIFQNDNQGFDCVIGNPPWDVLTLKKSEFFAKYNYEIAFAETKEKLNLIKKLEEQNPELFDLFNKKRLEFEKLKQYIKNSGRFQFSSKGSLDLYPLFVELGYRLLKREGTLGLLCPIGIIYTYNEFFEEIVSKNHLRKVSGFINKNKLFPAVSNLKQFLIILISKKNDQKPLFSFNNLTCDEANDDKRYFKMELDDLLLINPLTKTPPFPSNQKEYDILLKIYKNAECQLKGIKDKKNKIKIHRMFHISDDRKKKILFFKEELISEGLDFDNRTKIFSNKDDEYLPIYEGKLIFQYDFLYGTFENVSEEVRKSRRAKCLPNEDKLLELVEPRYWAKKEHFIFKISHWNYEKKWFLVYRESTGPRNSRTIVFTIIPWLPTVYTLYNFINISNQEALYYLTQFNSFVLDFVFRKKMATNHLTQVDISQLPLVPLNLLKKNWKLIEPLALELVYTHHRLDEYAREINYKGEIFLWDNIRRFELMRRLDAIYAILFNLEKDDIEYILEDFHIIKSRDIEDFGEFKSKKDVLEYYDEYLLLLDLSKE